MHGLNTFLLLFALFIKPFDECHEVLLDEIFLLSHLQQQSLELSLDQLVIFTKQLDFVVKLGQLPQNTIFILLVDLTQVNDAMSAVLPRPHCTDPNIPQSEQMASLQS